MLTKAQIEREFQRVKREFFPRWDRAGMWKVHAFAGVEMVSAWEAVGRYNHGRVPPRSVTGLCDPNSKLIWVWRSIDAKELSVVLIHEICHAVASQTHKNRWHKRMKAAAQTAEILRRPDLAAAILKELTT